MEFYLYNKDDRKSKTLVNLATTFKFDDINYVVYYNKQVEKSMIDIYIGNISYGDECLVITKIESDKQAKFLEIIKKILSGEQVATEDCDYSKIIDTATIVLDSVQKIQIPTSSLENLKKYHNLEMPTVEKEEQENEESIEKNEPEQKNNDELVKTDAIDSIGNEKDASSKNQDEEIVNSDNYIHSSSSLDDLDKLLNEKEKKAKKKNSGKTPLIRPSILILLILVLVGSAILYYFGTINS